MSVCSNCLIAVLSNTFDLARRITYSKSVDLDVDAARGEVRSEGRQTLQLKKGKRSIQLRT